MLRRGGQGSCPPPVSEAKRRVPETCRARPAGFGTAGDERSETKRRVPETCRARPAGFGTAGDERSETKRRVPETCRARPAGFGTAGDERRETKRRVPETSRARPAGFGTAGDERRETTGECLRRAVRARQDSEPLATSEASRGASRGRPGAATSRSEVARPAGLEPATPGLEGRCSIQLSYGRTRKW